MNERRHKAATLSHDVRLDLSGDVDAVTVHYWYGPSTGSGLAALVVTDEDGTLREARPEWNRRMHPGHLGSSSIATDTNGYVAGSPPRTRGPRPDNPASMRTEQLISRSILFISTVLAFAFVAAACGIGLLGVGGPKVRVENRSEHSIFIDAARLSFDFDETEYVPTRGWAEQIRVIGSDARVLPGEVTQFAAIAADRLSDERVIAVTALTQDTVEVIYQEFFTVGELKDTELVIVITDQRVEGREFR